MRGFNKLISKITQLKVMYARDILCLTKEFDFNFPQKRTLQISFNSESDYKV